MVLRYADALAASGWSPTIMMPSDLGEATFGRRLLRCGRYWVWRFTGSYRPTSWMKLHPNVRLCWLSNLHAKRAPRGDVVIASSVRTAEAISSWPESAGRKFYFVQGHETWDHPVQRVEASWRLPLSKFAVSRWLCDLIAGSGSRAWHLPNGLDHVSFGLDQPVDERKPAKIIWPHHWLPQKGSNDVVAVLSEFADIRLEAFGTAVAEKSWPGRIKYWKNLPQERLRALYNSASIMIAPSHAEGWGLPACEALQCGCALVATDIGGHREFLRDGRNALLYPPGDLRSLATAVGRLLENDDLRQNLARTGAGDMVALKFEVSVARLKHILSAGIPP